MVATGVHGDLVQTYIDFWTLQLVEKHPPVFSSFAEDLG